MKKKENKSRKNGINIFIILLTISVQVITASLVSCLLVFYGPFPVIRRMVVGTAMSSYSHQYIAKTFLSDAKISQILKDDEGTSTAEEEISSVKVNSNEGNTIDLYDINSTKYKGYMLVVKNPHKVKVGYTNNLTKQGERTSDIAKDHGALAAINGGGFIDKSTSGSLWAGTGAYPTGFVISNGKVVYQDVPETQALEVMAIDTDGKLIIGSHSINDLKKLNVTQAIAFGPALIVNGKPAFNGDGGQGITARTAIGQKEDGSILLLVIDGRRIDMPGATLHDMQKIMLDYGAYNAVNLDGGSSSTMYYKGSVINNPCNPLGERTVATALYVEP